MGGCFSFVTRLSACVCVPVRACSALTQMMRKRASRKTLARYLVSTPFLTVFGTFSGYFMGRFRRFLDHHGTKLRSFWGDFDHFGVVLGSLEDHFGIGLASFWGRFGVILTPF